MGMLAWLGRPRVVTTLRVVVSLVFIALVTVAALKTRGYWRVGWGGWPWLLLAILPVVLLLGFKALKWLLLLRRLAPEVSFLQALVSYLAGIPLSIMTPGRVGEVSRVMYLPGGGARGWSGVGAVLLDKLTDLVALIWWLAAGLYLAGLAWPALLLALLALALSPLWLWLELAPRLLGALPLPAAWREKMLAALPRSGVYPPGRLLGVIFLGVLCFGVEWVQYWALFNALAPEAGVGLGTTIAAMSLVTLAGVAQVSFAGIGVREGLTALLLWQSLPPGAAALGAFGVFLVDVALPGAVGLFFRPAVELSPPVQRS